MMGSLQRSLRPQLPHNSKQLELRLPARILRGIFLDTEEVAVKSSGSNGRNNDSTLHVLVSRCTAPDQSHEGCVLYHIIREL